MQTTLLRLFLSFHPAWLHLGLETVFNTTIDVADGESFVHVISRFIAQRLFMDPKIMKSKKYAFGSGKLIVTDAGRDALHSHFLYHTALFCYFVETAKSVSLVKHNPRMFARTSSFKCMDDVFAELSREVLSGSGLSLNKAFAKMGFKPSFKQGFADDTNYTVRTFADLTDGVILGSYSAIKAESIVAGNKDDILQVLWRLVGVYVSADDERNLRRASLALASKQAGIGPVPAEATGEQIVLHVCRQIGSQLGIQVDTLNDLRDGRVLAGAWRIYNVNAPDIRLYPGDTLFLNVANAAASDLDVPFGLHNSIGLFSVLFISRLFYIHELYNAAVRIQRAYRSYRFFKALKKMLTTAAAASTSQRDASTVMAATYTVEPVAAESPSTDKPNASADKRDELRSALRQLKYFFSKIRAKIEERKQRSEEQREEHAGRIILATATLIKLQAAVRGFLARKRFSDMVREKQEELRRERAAVSIQEEKAKREKEEEQARREKEEQAKREAEEKAKREAEEKAKREAEEKAKREAEEKAKREAEEKAKRQAEEKARREAEEKAKREAEEKAKREAEDKAKREAEEKAKREAEEQAKRERRKRRPNERRRKKPNDKRKRRPDERRRKRPNERRRKRPNERQRKRPNERRKKRLNERRKRRPNEKRKSRPNERRLKKNRLS
ncbi:unnamed protein product [Heligmosomoides polygyrus]|uniref:Calponin-homology (CH) domain-containing protein n=1 Tax=Heligmosomoides polygyrus TaxID=6339 RepID=A0A3P8I3K1_HELPZ|nr:unnamed protein product [Heligmosomoides polygyrus]